MTRYWALDYVTDRECELVVNDQLYATEDEAMDAVNDLPYYEVNWYTLADLKEDVYGTDVEIDENLVVHPVEW